MPLRFVIVLVSCVLTPLLAEEKVVLQYIPDSTVKLVHTIDAEVWHPIPALQITTSGTETLTASLRIKSRDKKKVINSLPIQGEFRLLNIEINTVVEPDNKAVTLNIRQANKPPFAELNKLLDKSLKFEVNQRFSLTSTKETAALAEVLPPLQEMLPERLLEGLLSPLFALAGSELQAGAALAFEDHVGIAGLALTTLKYDITEINPDSVKATYQGEIKPIKVALQDLVKKQDRRIEGLDLSMGGKVEGEALWQRKNALICTSSAIYNLSGGVKIFGMELPVTLTMKVAMSTQLDSAGP